MRIIRLIIISFIVIFLVITGISLFIPSNIQISKVILINAPKDFVSEQLSKPVNWKNWYPSPGTIQPFMDSASGIVTGIVLDTVKNNYLILSGIKNNEITAIYKKLPTGRQISTSWIIGESANGTTVEWRTSFHLRWYPWEKFSSLLFEKTYGVQMQKGLNNLKAALEK